MEIWYEVRFGEDSVIEEVEVVQVADHFIVTADGFPHLRSTMNAHFFRTEEEATTYVTRKEAEHIQRLRESHERAQAAYDALVRDGVPVKRLATAEEMGR